MVSGGAAAGLVLLPIVPRRIQTSGRCVLCRGGRPVHRQKANEPNTTETSCAPGASLGTLRSCAVERERDHHELAVLRRRPPYRDRPRGPGSNLRRRRRHLGRLRRVQRASPRVLSRPVPSLFLVVEPREPRSHLPALPYPVLRRCPPRRCRRSSLVLRIPPGFRRAASTSAARSTCSSARTIASWRARRCVVSFFLGAPEIPRLTNHPPSLPRIAG